MKIHSLHHAQFESLGSIKDWTDLRGFTVTSTLMYKSGDLPSTDDFDFLIIMGGPMGVYDESEFPWLKKEKIFIRESIEKRKSVLGICLGSQLVADVLGAKIYKNKFKEIGWFPVTFTKEALSNSFFNFLPEELIVFHWHGDTYDLPRGSVHLAQSSACINQAFIFGDRVIGLQFHLEATPGSLNEMIEGGKKELVKDTYVQTPREILSMSDYYDRNNRLLFCLLNRMGVSYPEEPKWIKAF